MISQAKLDVYHGVDRKNERLSLTFTFQLWGGTLTSGVCGQFEKSPQFFCPTRGLCNTFPCFSINLHAYFWSVKNAFAASNNIPARRIQVVHRYR